MARDCRFGCWSDSGLYLTQYRAYDPTAGRWLARDRLGEKADIAANLYAYVSDNPVNSVGPNGLWQVTLSGGAFLGGSVTFGINHGQFNVGAWGGFGEGVSLSVDCTNAPAQQPGFQGSVQGSIYDRLGKEGGYSVGATATFDSQRFTGLTVNGSYNLGPYAAASVSWDPSQGVNGVQPSVQLGVGTSAYAGVGGTYTW